MSPDGAGAEDRATLAFQGRELIVLRDKGGHVSIRERSKPAVRALNERWRAARDPRITATRDGAGAWRITIEGIPVLDVYAGDGPGTETRVIAERWASELREAFASRTRAVAAR